MDIGGSAGSAYGSHIFDQFSELVLTEKSLLVWRSIPARVFYNDEYDRLLKNDNFDWHLALQTRSQRIIGMAQPVYSQCAV